MGHRYGGHAEQQNNCNQAASAAVEAGERDRHHGLCRHLCAGCRQQQHRHVQATAWGDGREHTIGEQQYLPGDDTAGQPAAHGERWTRLTIPSSTPFILTGTAFYPNGTASLTHSWEQMDNAVATQTAAAHQYRRPCWEPLLAEHTGAPHAQPAGRDTNNDPGSAQ